MSLHFLDMEQQRNSSSSKLDLQDISNSWTNDSHDQIRGKAVSYDGETNISDEQLSTKGSKQSTQQVIIISNKEMKIRHELEKDIEKDLEEEIKEGIHNLALRLHRLYQHQRERNTRSNILTEMNISIRMEEGPKVEMKEIVKKEMREKNQHDHASISECRQGKMKKVVANEFDWIRTLRSETSTASIANNKPRNLRMVTKNYVSSVNVERGRKERKRWTNSL